MKVETWSTHTWLLLVFVTALLSRLGLWFIYPLTENNDSLTYIQLGKNLLNKGFATYNATRPPAYPVFLVLTDGWTYFAQLGLGVLTTLLFFYIGWKLSRRAWFGALAGLLHAMNIGQLFFEAALLTETLTTFLLAFSLAGTLFVWQQENIRWQLLVAFGAGLSAALAGMTRPLFAFLPFLLAFFLFLSEARPARRSLLGLVTALPAIIIFGAWLNFVNSNYKILSFDTIGGYRWLNHTGEYFEYVPDQYAALRDTYIRYRDQKIAQTGTQTNAAWDALDEMQKVTRLGYFGLSRLLTGISIDLIRAHPDLYLQNVLSGWWMFWWAAVYWSADALHAPGLAPVLSVLILVQRGLLIAANVLFVAGSSVAVLWKKLRERLGMNSFLWACLACIWCASIFQALLDHGDNPRYLIPMQSLVVLIVGWWFLCFAQNWMHRHETI